jgi:hypothetical protein
MIMGTSYAKTPEAVTGYAKPHRRPTAEQAFRTSRTHRIETLLSYQSNWIEY